jgi:uncharacterized protein
VTTILWHSERLASTERCHVPTDGHPVIEGVVLLPLAGAPAQVTYAVHADSGWRTLTTVVLVDAPGATRELRLEADGDGRWLVDGKPRADLDGALDVDVGITPSTNTLPIRRLALSSGERETVRAAWVRFPELTVEPLDQAYERLADDRYRYTAGSFEAELIVDGEGIVGRYGEDIWRTLARSSGS